MNGPVLVALGGNALVRPGDRGTVTEQRRRLQEIAFTLMPLASGDALSGGMVLTHGNGPQVGAHLYRSDLARAEVPPLPIDVAVALTQGEIGCVLEQALRSAFIARSIPREVVTLVTHVVVDPLDPDFQNPTKFVGQFFSEEDAKERQRRFGWRVRKDADRGWRRVVPSPIPRHIVETNTIRMLVAGGTVVIACGGGGVPVIETPPGSKARLEGIEAVVDKDRASALLATELGIPWLVILTGVTQVQVDYGKPSARPLGRVGLEELRAFQAEGQFPAGSMGPKIEAAIDFISHGGRECWITSPESLEAALSGGPCTILQA